MSRNFKFKAKVWLYPGLGGWHFVNVDKSLTEKIQKFGKKYGAGFIKVSVKTGKTSWQTALFPQKKTNSYLLSVKSSVRKKEGILAGDEIEILLSLV